MAFMHGLTLLREAVGREKRPLSWVAGPQGVRRADLPSTRDTRRQERRRAARLRSPDTV
jgi:NADH-quinone oxidoreductase subunit B